MSDRQSDEGVQLGKYRVIRRLASGGMGEVFLARVAGPAGFEKTLVLKRVLRRLQGEPRFIEMFLNEARVAAQLSHPNVVHIYELAELEGSYVIAMEYVEGLSLRALFTAVKGRLLTLSPSLAAWLCAQALHGLHYAHLLRDERGRVRGVVHRDVSPENILLGFNGAVKVADFGLARAAQAAVDLKPLGKVSYMAPEQRLGGLIDARADVYAMGVVLSEALTGEPLDGLSEVPRLPDPTLDGIVRRALSAHPDGRFLSAGEMAEALEGFARQSSDANTTRLGDLVRLAAVKLGPGEDSPGALTQLTVPAYLHGAQSSAPEAKSEDVVALSTPPPPPPTPPKPSRYAKQVRLTAELDAPAAAVMVKKKEESASPVRWLALGGLGLGAVLAVGLWLAAPRGAGSSVLDGGVASASLDGGVASASLNGGGAAASRNGVASASLDGGGAAASRNGVASASLDGGGASASLDGGAAGRDRGSPGSRRALTPAPPPLAAEGRGRVQVRVHPWAEVLWGGKVLGTTPFPPFELPAGTQTLTLRNAELNVTRAVTVQVRAGEEVSVFENLLK